MEDMKNIPTVAASYACLKEFLGQARAGFVLNRISLGDMPSWGFRDGALSHASGGFFSIVGLETPGPEPEQAVFLYQPQSAITGVLTTIMAGERHFLLQVRAEPGTPDAAQYGPTIQCTPANYLRAHGGKPTPYIEHFTTYRPGIRILHDSMQLDFGERYLYKYKRLLIAECGPEVPVHPSFLWVPASLAQRLTGEDTLCNTDLRSLLAVAAWDNGGPGDLRPESRAVRDSLAAPVRPAALALVMAALDGSLRICRFKDLRELEHWEVTESGIRERGDAQGFDVEYYYVEAPGREVASWTQPLINSRTSGQAVLFCRLDHGQFQVLVRSGAERGLSTGKALLPSRLVYPGGQAWDAAELPGAALCGILVSDEGGRFFRDTSTYELRLLAPGEAVAEADGVWLSVSELKRLLQHSNLCSIQLRGLASLLLGPLPALADMAPTPG